MNDKILKEILLYIDEHIQEKNLVCNDCIHESGTEIILRPDRDIFGDLSFDFEVIREWIELHTADKKVNVAY